MLILTYLLKCKIIIFIALTMLSTFAMAMSFQQTQQLAYEGDAEAQFNLGKIYANGKDVGQNYTKAVDWYLKSADQDHSMAQYNLGLIYSHIYGVP